MLDFEAYVSKLGEHGLQAILENWERFQGIGNSLPMPLESRWERFLQETAAISSFDS